MANGGVDGLEGPGVAFYRRFPRINVHLVSASTLPKPAKSWTDAELESTIEIRTAIAQELMCPWDTYPIHPALGRLHRAGAHLLRDRSPVPRNRT